jgi:hypothetical protein
MMIFCHSQFIFAPQLPTKKVHSVKEVVCCGLF